MEEGPQPEVGGIVAGSVLFLTNYSTAYVSSTDKVFCRRLGDLGLIYKKEINWCLVLMIKSNHHIVAYVIFCLT